MMDSHLLVVPGVKYLVMRVRVVSENQDKSKWPLYRCYTR
jgi:hypothetical protein